MAHELLVRVVDDSPPAQKRFCTLQSRFSTLPVELKLKILGYFSFEDAARTGILSSTSNLSERSQVILDKRLFEKRGRWITLHPTAWANKVAQILTNHRKGLIPIRKFILHIPDMQFNWELYINIWISFLSGNGIEELSVDNWNIITFKLSSFLFECPELTQLMLRNCAFRKSVGSFQSLQFLCLEKTALRSDGVGDITLETPSLVWMELIDCTGYQYLDIQAPKRRIFFAATSVGMSENHMALQLPELVVESMGPQRWWLKDGFLSRMFSWSKFLDQEVNHLELWTKAEVSPDRVVVIDMNGLLRVSYELGFWTCVSWACVS